LCMRIAELNLIRYGKFTDRSLVFRDDERDIHLVVGPNEAGKSTLRAALCDWLFGIPVRTPLDFLHPMPEMRVGGVMERRSANAVTGERLAFHRIKATKNTLRTPQDGHLADGILLPWLGNLQAQTFQQMYALDHSMLVRGGAGILSASGDLGQMLFESASGLEDLGEALRSLQKQADALWAPRKAQARAYYQARESFEVACVELRQASLRTRDWKAQHDALNLTGSQLTEAKAEDLKLRKQLRRLERIRRVRPLLLALDESRAQRQALLAEGEVPLLEKDAFAVYSRAMHDIALAEAERARLELTVHEIQEQLRAVPVDAALLGLADEICEFNERRLQFRKHRADLIARAEEVRLEWVRVQELAAGLGFPADHEEAIRQRLPATAQRSRLDTLIRARPALAVALSNAEANLLNLQGQIDKAHADQTELPGKTVDPDLKLALEKATELGDHAQRLEDLRLGIERCSERIEHALTALGPWRKPPDLLRSMLVPDKALLQSLLDQDRAEAAREMAAREALDSKISEVARLELDLQQFVRTFQPISREQLAQARNARDKSWDAIKQAPQSLEAKAQTFEAEVVRADQLADDRLERAQREADRQAKTESLEHRQRERAELEHQLEQTKAARLQRAADWDALTAACGLPALPLAAAQGWFQFRYEVLMLDEERRLMVRSLAELQGAAARCSERLWRGLGHPGAEPVPDLAFCAREARALLAQADQAQGQSKVLAQQIAEGHRELPKLHKTKQAAQDRWAEWSQSWEAAVQSLGYEPNVAVDQVEAELLVMQQVEQRLERIRGIRSERIETMQADLEGLTATAESLKARIAPELAGWLPEAIARELAERLDRAQQAESEAKKLTARLEQSQSAGDEINKRLDAIRARLAPLIAAACVHDAAGLRRAIERSDARRAFEERILALEHDLSEAAESVPLEELREECARTGADADAEEMARLDAAAVDAIDRIASLGNAFGAQKGAFDALDGQDRAARAEAKRHEAIAAMAESAEQYLRIQTAVRLLKWSIEKFRETSQGPMLSRASSIFSKLTLDSFRRLLVDSVGTNPRLICMRPDGAQLDVSGLSEGSRDQLYLALRLAALELQVEQGYTMPLIADDLFINFDDLRTAAGLRALGDLSHSMQIVFLTHHDHLVPLAREILGDGLNVIFL
jgi:uncharacterized protein YhaN